MSITNEATDTFIPSSFGGSVAASNDLLHKGTSYQQLVYMALARGLTTERFTLLGRHLASLARFAQATRRPNDVENISQLMRALPLPKSLQALTYYYEGLRLSSAGHLDAAQKMLYRAVDDVAPEYKPRVFQELGIIEDRKGDIDAAVPFFVLAGKLGREHDPITFVQSQQLIAYIQSCAGDFSWAVRTFESVFPLVVRTARAFPILYHIALNNFAVRLGEAGRIDDANAAVNIALSSRYAPAFPEWTETHAELQTKSRHLRPSFIALSSIRPANPESPKRASSAVSKTKHTRVPVIIRVFHWLAGLSIFEPVSAAILLSAPTSVDVEALLPISTEWLKNGPPPRAPPSFRPKST